MIKISHFEFQGRCCGLTQAGVRKVDVKVRVGCRHRSKERSRDENVAVNVNWEGVALKTTSTDFSFFELERQCSSENLEGFP